MTDPRYVQVEELKATTEMTGTSFADEDIPAAIDAACRAIDQYCGRIFYNTGNDETRYYTALTPGYVQVDDLISATTLSTDPIAGGTFEDVWDATDFYLAPRNATVLGWPHTVVARVNGGSFYFPRFGDSVKVIGKFGWPEVPAQVRQATTILATRLLRRAREAPFGVLTIGIDVGSVARLPITDPDVRFLLDPYRKWKPLL